MDAQKQETPSLESLHNYVTLPPWMTASGTTMRVPSPGDNILLGICFLIGVLGLAGNAVMIFSIIVIKPFRQPANVFFFHHGLIEIAKSALIIPYALSIAGKAPTYCEILSALQCVLITATSFNLAAIAVNESFIISHRIQLTPSIEVAVGPSASKNSIKSSKGQDQRDSPMKPKKPKVKKMRRSSSDESSSRDDSASRTSSIGAHSLQRNISCVVFGMIIIWMASLVLNMGVSLITGSGQYNSKIGLCYFVYGHQKSYVVNAMWIVITTLGIAAAIGCLRKLKSDIAKSQNKLVGSIPEALKRQATLATVTAGTMTNRERRQRLQEEREKMAKKAFQETRSLNCQFNVIVLMTTTFVLFWYPLFLLILVDNTFSVDTEIYKALTVLAWLNAPLTPVFFTYFNYECYTSPQPLISVTLINNKASIDEESPPDNKKQPVKQQSLSRISETVSEHDQLIPRQQKQRPRYVEEGIKIARNKMSPSRAPLFMVQSMPSNIDSTDIGDEDFNGHYRAVGDDALEFQDSRGRMITRMGTFPKLKDIEGKISPTLKSSREARPYYGQHSTFKPTAHRTALRNQETVDGEDNEEETCFDRRDRHHRRRDQEHRRVKLHELAELDQQIRPHSYENINDYTAMIRARQLKQAAERLMRRPEDFEYPQAQQPPPPPPSKASAASSVPRMPNIPSRQWSRRQETEPVVDIEEEDEEFTGHGMLCSWRQLALSKQRRQLSNPRRSTSHRNRNDQPIEAPSSSADSYTTEEPRESLKRPLRWTLSKQSHDSGTATSSLAKRYPTQQQQQLVSKSSILRQLRSQQAIDKTTTTTTASTTDTQDQDQPPPLPPHQSKHSSVANTLQVPSNNKRNPLYVERVLRRFAALRHHHHHHHHRHRHETTTSSEEEAAAMQMQDMRQQLAANTTSSSTSTFAGEFKPATDRPVSSGRKSAISGGQKSLPQSIEEVETEQTTTRPNSSRGFRDQSSLPTSATAPLRVQIESGIGPISGEGELSQEQAERLLLLKASRKSPPNVRQSELEPHRRITSLIAEFKASRASGGIARPASADDANTRTSASEATREVWL